jgi:EAL and modified HD-GYP domain-containing signal transduction protein
MAASVELIRHRGQDAIESPGCLHVVVRQPILDLRGRVHAYELLFRGKADRDGVTVESGLAENAAEFGLERPSELKKLTGKLTAFVSCPISALSLELAQVLPASLTVLEVCADVENSQEQIVACQELKALGFRFALDNPCVEKRSIALLELVDYIKVDFNRTTPEARRDLLHELHPTRAMMLASGVKTHMDYQQARREGFTLFQGYYFCEPVAVRNRRPPVNQMLRLEILKALQQTTMDMRRVGQMVKRDGPLTYQLLRLVNSPVWGMRQNVESIDVALVAVGENAFRRIATLAIASEFNGDQPAELLCLAMTRARICEAMAPARGLDPFGQYLMGLLSLLPAMQGQPMSEVVRTLPLSEEILAALLGNKNSERAVLGWLENFECGDWLGCDAEVEAGGLDQRELAKAYIDALAWTETALHLDA